MPALGCQKQARNGTRPKGEREFMDCPAAVASY
jgi:hypothetical protein